MGYYVTVESDVEIFVEDLNPGGNKTVFFVHGWPGNHNLFEYQFNQLPRLEYRCIAVDCRGSRLSDKPWSGYDYNRLAGDIRAVIDALRLRNITLAGHSMGGAICLHYMARHNGHGVSKLALFVAAAPSLIQRPNFLCGLQREAILDIIQGTYTDRPKILVGFSNMIFFHCVGKPVQDWIFQLGLQAVSRSTVAIASTWLSRVLFDDMAKVNVPTLILRGLSDRVYLYPLAVAQNEGIKNSKLVSFQQYGHFLFYDQMDKFNRELVVFTQNDTPLIEGSADRGDLSKKWIGSNSYPAPGDSRSGWLQEFCSHKEKASALQVLPLQEEGEMKLLVTYLHVGST